MHVIDKMNKYIEKLYTLVDPRVQDSKLFELVLDADCIITGWCLLYAMLDDIDRNAVPAINIMIPDVSIARQLIDTFDDLFGGNIIYGRHPNTSSVIVCRLFQTNILIHLCVLKFEHPIDIAEAMPVDCIQCAMNKTCVLRTLTCVRAHENRRMYMAALPVHDFVYKVVLDLGFIADGIPTAKRGDRACLSIKSEDIIDERCGTTHARKVQLFALAEVEYTRRGYSIVPKFHNDQSEPLPAVKGPMPFSGIARHTVNIDGVMCLVDVACDDTKTVALFV